MNNRKKIYFKDAILFNLNCYENKKKTKQSIFIDLVVEDFNTKQKLICQGL